MQASIPASLTMLGPASAMSRHLAKVVHEWDRQDAVERCQWQKLEARYKTCSPSRSLARFDLSRRCQRGDWRDFRALAFASGSETCYYYPPGMREDLRETAAASHYSKPNNDVPMWAARSTLSLGEPINRSARPCTLQLCSCNVRDRPPCGPLSS